MQEKYIESKLEFNANIIIMIIDTHAHCYWENILPRIDEIVQNMKEKNVTQAIQIGCDIATSNQAIGLAEKFPGVFYATV